MSCLLPMQMQRSTESLGGVDNCTFQNPPLGLPSLILYVLNFLLCLSGCTQPPTVKQSKSHGRNYFVFYWHLLTATAAKGPRRPLARDKFSIWPPDKHRMLCRQSWSDALRRRGNTHTTTKRCGPARGLLCMSFCNFAHLPLRTLKVPGPLLFLMPSGGRQVVFRFAERQAATHIRRGTRTWQPFDDLGKTNNYLVCDQTLMNRNTPYTASPLHGMT